MTIEQFNTICEHIEGGLSLREASIKEGFKSAGSFSNFLAEKESPTLNEHYARACAERVMVYADKIIEVAFCQEDDVSTGPNGEKVINHNVIQRNTLQVNTLKWMLSKMNPKKYGDKVDVTSEGEKIQSIPAIHWVKDADGDTNK